MLCNDQDIMWLALCFKTRERKATSLVIKVWKKLKVSVLCFASCLLQAT